MHVWCYFFYLFIFIQVNSAVLLRDLGKLNTNVTVSLPVAQRERWGKNKSNYTGTLQILIRFKKK